LHEAIVATVAVAAELAEIKLCNDDFPIKIACYNSKLQPWNREV